MSINWTQAILIQAGVLLQIVAICAFIRQRVNSARTLPTGSYGVSGKKKARGDDSTHQPTQRMNLQNWSPTRGAVGMGSHHLSHKR